MRLQHLPTLRTWPALVAACAFGVAEWWALTRCRLLRVTRGLRG